MDEEQQAISFHDILMVGLRQRRIILGVFGGVVAVALLGILLLPPGYTASTKVLLTTEKTDISTSAEKPTEIQRVSTVSDAEAASEIQILRSRELIEDVLKQMGVTGEDAPKGLSAVVDAIVQFPATALSTLYHWIHGSDPDAQNDPLYWIMVGVQNSLIVTRVEKSNVIDISYSARDPRWARDFVNRLTTSYLAWHTKMRQIATEGFFSDQSHILQQKLGQSETALKQLREKAGALAGQQAEVHQRLNEFSAELARTRIGRAEQQERVAYLEQVRAGAGRNGRVATPQLLDLEGKRAELLGRYRPDSERVREIDAQIDRLRKAIAGYDTITADAGSQNGTDLLAARTALVALKGKEDALAIQSEEFRKQAEMLDAQGIDLARLERQVKIDEEAYLSYVRTAEESRLSSALEQSKLLQLTIVEPAGFPQEPSSPHSGRIMLFAIFGGLIVGAGAGFARDQFDTTVKSAADVRRYADLEVLTVLPDRA